MRNYSAKNVDEYIANAPEGARSKMSEIRSFIKSIAPEADEAISWGVPFYRYYGLLAGFAAFKSHISFGLVATLDGGDRKVLKEMGYKTGSKTIQIGFDQEVPAAMIKKILDSKIADNKAKNT